MNKENIVKLSPVVILAIAGSVFAMHYGASCMLWPTTWGRDSQSMWFLAFLGFLFTGLLLPFLGYFAVERAGGPLFTIASRVGPSFAQIFGGFTVLLMGPFFVIPRMSAAAWDALSKIFGLEASPWIFVVLFTIVYYAITYWFIYSETDIVDKVSKLLVPILLVLELAIITKSLMNPIGVPGAPLYDNNPFSFGFVNGYQTMDLPASLMFAGIILADIANRVNNHKPSVMANLIKAGLVGFILLAIIEVGEFALGASTGETLADVNYAKLFATIVLIQWGKIGGAVFNVALVFAAMTTAIGLTAGTAQYFVDASHGKWKYQTVAIVTLVVSTLISVCGLEQIITLTAPLLNMIYPPCIALILFTVFATKYVGAMRGACYLTFLWGIVEAIRGYMGVAGIENGMQGLYNIIPFANTGFGWVIFFVVGAIIGHFYLQDKDAGNLAA